MRRRLDISPESEDPTVDGYGQLVLDPSITKAFYKSTLLRSHMSSMQDVNMDEEFGLKDGGMVTEVFGGIPTITFFDRVHKYIEHRMAKTIIVKLLGKSIGFNALLNKITFLWCPKSHIQLMDLENDHYLVRFNTKDDYSKVVLIGLWVIF